MYICTPVTATLVDEAEEKTIENSHHITSLFLSSLNICSASLFRNLRFGHDCLHLAGNYFKKPLSSWLLPSFLPTFCPLTLSYQWSTVNVFPINHLAFGSRLIDFWSDDQNFQVIRSNGKLKDLNLSAVERLTDQLVYMTGNMSLKRTAQQSSLNYCCHRQHH